ncbi:MAG: class I SAM-dependent methyltransferase [Nonomuraea sp.]|nr:class I SAM-dependent methyltransferase [Nonomuraea sp.]
MTYASLRAGRGPNAFVAEALGVLTSSGSGVRGRALDIGAGPLNDTLFLLELGFSVDAVDTDPCTVALAAARRHPRLTIVHADVRDMDIEAGAYSFMVAIHVLPFLPRADVVRLAVAMSDGLAAGGVLCCTFFGPEDAWAGRPGRTFLRAPEAGALFHRLEPVVLREERYDGVDARDEPKFWHVVRCVFRKPVSSAPRG